MVKRGILTHEKLGFDNFMNGHGAGYHGIIERDNMMLSIGIGGVHGVPHFQRVTHLWMWISRENGNPKFSTLHSKQRRASKTFVFFF